MSFINKEAVTAAIQSQYAARLKSEWLEQCIAHLDSELVTMQSQGHQYLDIDTQVSLVFEQLLNSEISESCMPALKTTPQNKVYGLLYPPAAFLQIQDISDVGVSKFTMWEALKEKEDFELRGIRPSYLPPTDDDDLESTNVHTASNDLNTQDSAHTQSAPAGNNDGPQPTPRSMLKLVLTDGNASISALELTPVPQLHVELPIGTKVLITGAHLIQPSGLLVLNENCIKAIGGAPSQYIDLTLKSRTETSLGIKLHRSRNKD